MLESVRHSLTLRLIGIFLLLGGLFVWGTLGAIRWVYNSDDIRGLISGHLSLHVHYVREDIGSPPDIESALEITRSVPVDIRILGPDTDWASNPAFPRLDELSFGPSPAFSDDPGAWVDELRGVEFAKRGDHNFLKMMSGDYAIVVSSPRIGDLRDGPDLVVLIVALGLGFLLLGFLAVRWLFLPIEKIREGAANIGQGNFGHRIANRRRDELGELADDINSLAADVEAMLDAKRALLLGISHEMRSPLSRMRLLLEFIDDGRRDDLKAEIIEMETIVVSLLEAERLNTRHATLLRSQVRMDELIDDMIDSYFDRERARIGVTIGVDDRHVDCDEARITLLLKNLVSNALRFASNEPAAVRIDVSAGDDAIVIRVADDGPGLSREQANRIGEPFFRSDPSRTRSSGGSGLGLYLALLIARAHGGSLRLVNPGAAGAVFELRLPGDRRADKVASGGSMSS